MLKMRIHYRSGKSKDIQSPNYEPTQFRDWVLKEIFGGTTGGATHRVDFALFDDGLVNVSEIERIDLIRE